MISIVNKPTRVTKNTASCIDHIYTSSYLTQDILAGIIKTDVSDHFPIFVIDNNTKTTNYPTEIEKEIRQINDINITKFKNILHDTDWMVVLNTYDPNFAYDLFFKTIFKDL